ncbi:MAG TPA: hypothetical protein VM658_00080 [bacterium]|nr:hypothetical protein [bacterium]
MRAYALSRHVRIILLIVLSTLATPGCEKIRKIFVKRAPEGMTRRSFTIPLNGYENTVDVEAPQPDLMLFISGIPGILQERLMIIKQGVEPKG